MAAREHKAESASHNPRTSEPGPDDFPDRYASMCEGRCLEPAYHHGDCLVFSKSEEPEPGDFVGFWLDQAELAPGETPRRVKRLHKRITDGGEPLIVFEQLNPPIRIRVRASRVLAMHKLIGVASLNSDGTASLHQPHQEG